ncbi:MAG: nucleotidyltransferase family protein [Prevotella sp.]|nr:nucleotidyltransferase family protein [Prevotella sp.]
MQQLFYELLQVAVGQADCLGRGPSEEEWHQLYDMARRHQLTGICYRGVERLFDYGLRAPQDLSIDWMADVEQLKEDNEKVLKRLQLVQKRLAEKDIRSSVLSAQGAAARYKAELRSLCQPVGIDLYVDCEVGRAVRFVELTGQQHVRRDANCVFLDKWEDTPIRLHCLLDFRANPLKTGTIRRWLQEHKEQFFEKEGALTLPSQSLAMVYALLELHGSVMAGRATMRQLMDCYSLLRNADGHFAALDAGQTQEDTLKTLGIAGFAKGVMWLLQRSLLVERQMMICAPSEAEGRFIEAQIMNGRQLWPMLCRYPLQTLFSL